MTLAICGCHFCTQESLCQTGPLSTRSPFSWHLPASGCRNLIPCWESERYLSSSSCPYIFQLSVANTINSSTSPSVGRVLVHVLPSPFHSPPCTLALVISSASSLWIIWVPCQKFQKGRRILTYNLFSLILIASPACLCSLRDTSRDICTPLDPFLCFISHLHLLLLPFHV